MLDALFFPFTQAIVGFALLVWGADRFVTGAAATAKNLNISPLVIGLVVVGLATSAPEMFVSSISSFQGRPNIAIGNAVGSNITNIALILGLTALLLPIAVTSQIVKRELPLLLLVTLISWVLLLDNELGRLDGAILLFGIVLVMTWLVRTALKQRQNGLQTLLEDEAASSDSMSLTKSCAWLLFGIVILLVGSNILIKGAVDIATYFNISELVIGLTIIAIGTSLPELAASIVAATKRHHEMVIGNVIGSNMFNLLVVLAIPGLVQPSKLPSDVLSRDLPVMLGLTALFFFMAYSFRKRPNRINRLEGGLLLTCFILYELLIYHSISTA